MEPDRTEKYQVWIDENNRIISFVRMKGALRYTFPSREMMLDYVMEKGTSGYRIQ